MKDNYSIPEKLEIVHYPHDSAIRIPNQDGFIEEVCWIEAKDKELAEALVSRYNEYEKLKERIKELEDKIERQTNHYFNNPL